MAASRGSILDAIMKNGMDVIHIVFRLLKKDMFSSSVGRIRPESCQRHWTISFIPSIVGLSRAILFSP